MIRTYIKTREESMTKAVEAWKTSYPDRLSGTPDDQAKKKEDLNRLAREICNDLEGILGHLGRMGAMLQDHYSAARSICAESSISRDDGLISQLSSA